MEYCIFHTRKFYRALQWPARFCACTRLSEDAGDVIVDAKWKSGPVSQCPSVHSFVPSEAVVAKAPYCPCAANQTCVISLEATSGV